MTRRVRGRLRSRLPLSFTFCISSNSVSLVLRKGIFTFLIACPIYFCIILCVRDMLLKFDLLFNKGLFETLVDFVDYWLIKIGQWL